MRVYLDFGREQTPVHRARIGYAFRLFCAIYGYQPILQPTEAASADVCLSYSELAGRGEFARTVRLGNFFKSRDPREAAPAPTAWRWEDEPTVLIHGASEDGTADWLGEIFEWVSCSDEYSVTARDSVGRIPFSGTYAGRHGLDIRRPYAAIAMRRLQREIRKLVPAAPTAPVSPTHGPDHFIINTHDVDFAPLSRLESARRLARNSAISLFLLKSPKLAVGQLIKALSVAAGGKDPLDQILRLAECENQRSLKASYFFIPNKRHKRDANYSLDQPPIRDLIGQLQQLDMEVGVHGSYTSLEATGGLRSEFESFREQGLSPLGGRQHWLRYSPDRLVAAVEESGAYYDMSMGWSDRVGFRAGACFAFPPYNFDREQAARFLEMPLAIMDQALLGTAERRRDPFQAATELLANSRRYGWGGISLLWHPAAFDGVQLPAEVGRVFWRLMDQRSEWNDTWLSGSDFLKQVRPRYEEAGFPLNDQAVPEPTCLAMASSNDLQG